MSTGDPEVVVVGSGPNGLAAALTLARAGHSVRVLEGAEEPGGGCRSAELTLPGFVHDVCSAVHPLALASPFFASLDLAELGVEFAHPEVQFAHPIEGRGALALYRSVEQTSVQLGADARRYRALLDPLVADADSIVAEVLSPMRRLPRHPLAFARYAALAPLSAAMLARALREERTRALLAGLAAHSMRPLRAPVTAGFALLLAMLGHAVGWPVVRGGSGQLAAALRRAIESAGGEVVTGSWVSSLGELGAPRALLLDCTPEQFVQLAGERLSPAAKRRYRRFRYGPGVCKVDYALSGPVPWLDEACRRAGTVHLGGTFDEVAASEAAVAGGRHAERPFVLVAQPGVVDDSRAPQGRATLWAYCHVPNGSDRDMSAEIGAQIERFAPGFGELVLDRHVFSAVALAAKNPNYVGGDINGGAATLRQTLLRPTAAWNPYRTPLEGVYLCSSSTPPGGGVHGMCGANAAAVALRERFSR